MPNQNVEQIELWIKISILTRLVAGTSLKYVAGHSLDDVPDLDLLADKLEHLINATCKKLGLIPPETDATCRKTESSQAISFESWFDKMLAEFCSYHYPKILCSQCPFSLGLKNMIDGQGAAPCSLLGEIKLISPEPSKCIVLTSGYWQEGFLIQQIILQKGQGMVSKFLNLEGAP